MMTTRTIGPRTESTFVTVVAWLGLIVSGFAVLAGLMQLLMLTIAGPFPSMSAGEAASAPPFFAFVVDNLLAFVLGNILFHAVAFGSALGVLRRKEWARKVMIGVLLIAAAAAASIGLAQHAAIGEMFQDAADVPPEGAALMNSMRIFTAVLTLGFVSVFLWMAYRFGAEDVRAEFD